MTGPVTINASTRGYDAFMATLIGVQPVQTGTPGTGHSGDLTPFDAHLRATAAARQANAKQTPKAGA
jgi:hypothetical protein